MKNPNITALEKLGYTNVNIDNGGTPRSDMSNITADQQINITYQDLVSAASIEIAWNDIRAKRNKLLRDSDWASGTDIPDSIKTIMIPYRQALRDITIQFNSPIEVVFPDLPEV